MFSYRIVVFGLKPQLKEHYFMKEIKDLLRLRNILIYEHKLEPGCTRTSLCAGEAMHCYHGLLELFTKLAKDDDRIIKQISKFCQYFQLKECPDPSNFFLLAKKCNMKCIISYIEAPSKLREWEKRFIQSYISGNSNENECIDREKVEYVSEASAMHEHDIGLLRNAVYRNARSNPQEESGNYGERTLKLLESVSSDISELIGLHRMDNIILESTGCSAGSIANLVKTFEDMEVSKPGDNGLGYTKTDKMSNIFVHLGEAGVLWTTFEHIADLLKKIS